MVDIQKTISLAGKLARAVDHERQYGDKMSKRLMRRLAIQLKSNIAKLKKDLDLESLRQ